MATHIKNLIKNFLKDKKHEVNEKIKIEKIIDKNLTVNLKKHIKLQGVHKKTLIFCSDSSSANYEFGLRKENLLKAVKKEFPNIDAIKIKINDYDGTS